MTKLYLSLLSVILLSSCKKDFDEDIIGTWNITEVNVPGFGNTVPAGLPFKDGTVSFHQDGSAFYTNTTGTVYQGKWSLERKRQGESNYYTLLISVVHFPSQQILLDAFDDVIFLRKDHFKAEVSFDNKTYVTHFKR
jgi:hypothetical protein